MLGVVGYKGSVKDIQKVLSVTVMFTTPPPKKKTIVTNKNQVRKIPFWCKCSEVLRFLKTGGVCIGVHSFIVGSCSETKKRATKMKVR